MKEAPSTSRFAGAFRWLLLAYLVFIFCPYRYCVPLKDPVDSTWFFAVNYAAAHHLVIGRDIFWTYGPLAYLLVPFDIGNNLAWALAAQTVLWVLFAAAIWDLFIRSRISLLNLIAFSILLALTSVNYWQELYPGNLLLCVALIFLVHFHLRGGRARLLVALIMMGMMPLISFMAAVIAAAIVAGFVVDRLVTGGRDASRDTILSVAVALFTASTCVLCTLGSFHAMSGYARTSLELASGYSTAMSRSQAWLPFATVLAAFLVFVIVLTLLIRLNPGAARFFAFILLTPVLIELRHSLVRADAHHVIQFFSFTALAMALIALSASFECHRVRRVSATAISLFAILWLIDVGGNDLQSTLASLVGLRTPRLVWNALHHSSMRRSLRELAEKNFPNRFRIEPEIRLLIGEEQVAFLSNTYSNASLEGLNVSLAPVFQRYSAYTPYLDGLNARWIATKGPRYLLFDGKALDNRQPWTESPATWLEVYRWYSKRVLGSRNLLLQRRPQPRFQDLEQIEQSTASFGTDISVPLSSDPIFWTMVCPLNRDGRLRTLLYRIPEVTITVTAMNAEATSYRAIIPVLVQPSLGNYLPSNLAQFGEVFNDHPNFDFSVDKLNFSGPGGVAYDHKCHLTFLRAVADRPR